MLSENMWAAFKRPSSTSLLSLFITSHVLFLSVRFHLSLFLFHIYLSSSILKSTLLLAKYTENNLYVPLQNSKLLSIMFFLLAQFYIFLWQSKPMLKSINTYDSTEKRMKNKIGVIQLLLPSIGGVIYQGEKA